MSSSIESALKSRTSPGDKLRRTSLRDGASLVKFTGNPIDFPKGDQS